MSSEKTNGIFTLGVIQRAMSDYSRGERSAGEVLEEIRAGLERLDRANEAGRSVWEEATHANG